MTLDVSKNKNHALKLILYAKIREYLISEKVICINNGGLSYQCSANRYLYERKENE